MDMTTNTGQETQRMAPCPAQRGGGHRALPLPVPGFPICPEKKVLQVFMKTPNVSVFSTTTDSGFHLFAALGMNPGVFTTKLHPQLFWFVLFCFVLLVYLESGSP